MSIAMPLPEPRPQLCRECIGRRRCFSLSLEAGNIRGGKRGPSSLVVVPVQSCIEEQATVPDSGGSVTKEIRTVAQRDGRDRALSRERRPAPTGATAEHLGGPRGCFPASPGSRFHPLVAVGIVARLVLDSPGTRPAAANPASADPTASSSTHSNRPHQGLRPSSAMGQLGQRTIDKRATRRLHPPRR